MATPPDREALAVLRRDAAFDGVLMDCQMPVMDGFQATLAIRQDLGLTTLPVLAMTANAMAADRTAALNAGIGQGGAFVDNSLDDELDVIRLNVLGTVHLAKLVLDEMVRVRTGERGESAL